MSEIRMRDVSPQLMKQANEVAAYFNEKTVTAALEKLILQFNQDQKTLEANRQEIRRLGSQVTLYQKREEGVKNILNQVIYIHSEAQSYYRQTINQAAGVLKIMAGKRIPAGTKKRKKVPAGKRSGKPGKKIVPARKKKGGKK